MFEIGKKYNIYLNKDRTEKYKIQIIDIDTEENNIIFQILNETPIIINDNVEDLGNQKYKCSHEYFKEMFGIKEDQITINITKKQNKSTNTEEIIKKWKKRTKKKIIKIEDKYYEKLCSNGSYYCCYLCKNTFYQNHHINFRRIIDILDLDYYQKVIIYDRFLRIIEYYYCSKRCYDFQYYMMKFLIQSCSIVVPALLSIDYFFTDSTIFIDKNTSQDIDLENLYNDISTQNIENPIFWAVWGLSLLVGLLTNIMGLFGIESKFFTTGQTYLKMVSEGWQYFELTGKYGIPEEKKTNKNIINTHKNQFNNFCNEIEKLYKDETELRYVAPISSDGNINRFSKDDSSSEED